MAGSLELIGQCPGLVVGPAGDRDRGPGLREELRGDPANPAVTADDQGTRSVEAEERAELGLRSRSRERCAGLDRGGRRARRPAVRRRVVPRGWSAAGWSSRG